MDTEAMNYKAGDFIDYTPSTVKVAGEMVETAGRAAMCATAIAASALGAAQIKGIVKVKAAAVTGNAGDVVGWDEDGDPYGGTAGTGAATTALADADFLIGTLTAALTATAGVAKVELNTYGSVQMKLTKLTAAQIKALAATQIELIPAPGADRITQVLGIQMILDYGSEVLAEPSAPDDLEVVYDAAGGTSIADVIGDFVISSADTIAQPQIKDIAGAAATTMVNKAVVLDNTGGEYTGNATGDTVLIVVCTYKTIRAALA